ncbi:unnamed protein product, partial [Mesorhabditis belari]|uniref:Uncharacterized protein n=1 Tax=Mesorhabditis belari TaxID=2138241 RepID=A0AAF3FM17_9BILA
MLYNLSGFPIVLFGIYDVNLIATRIDLFIVYRLLLVLEMIGIFYALTVGLIACKIIYESNVFHHNFTNVLVVFLVEHALSQVGRGILMGYQYGVFKITGEICSDLPLFFLSLFRFFVYAAALLILGNMVIERSMAIFFIKDYESLAVKIIYESNEFNRNLINSLALFLCQQIVSQIGRLILLIYQSGVLGITGNPLNDLPVLILCSYRLCAMIACIALIQTVILERAIAILYIRDYESLKRPWIEWCLHTVTFLVQLGGLSIFCYCFSFLSDLTYKIIYPLPPSSRHIGLSCELWKMLIKKIFFAQCCFGVIAATLFSVPHFFFEDSTAEMELGMASLDALHSPYVMIFHSTFIYIVPSWREKFKENLRRIFKRQKVDVKKKAIFVGVDHILQNEEGNVYFDELRKMWA